jgi:hypothetical protein
MYSFYKKTFWLLLILLTTVKFLNAQFTYNLSEYQVGAQIGGMVSRTSLTFDKLGAYKQMHPSIDFFVERKIFKPISIRASLLFGQIASNDEKANDKKYPWLPLRDFKFKTSMAELSTIFVWNLRNEKYDLFSHSHSHRFSPYFFAGIGVSFVSIKRDWSGIDETTFGGTPTMLGLGLDTTAALPKAVTVFPMGGGVRYAITPQLSLFSEINFRYTFEPYLDGYNFSTSRSNSKDFYYGISVGVAFRPTSRDFRNNCPKSVR